VHLLASGMEDRHEGLFPSEKNNNNFQDLDHHHAILLRDHRRVSLLLQIIF
jgi:hypothetical protein